MDSRRLQSQCNDIEDDNDVELPLAQNRKMENSTDVGTIILTEAAIGKRGLNISIRKASCIIG